jgi:glycyl-tRNA synthetase beta subunit
MLTERQLTKLFGNPVFVGTVLRYATMLEYDMDCLLALYLSRPERVDFVLDSVLPLKHTKAHGDAIGALRGFQRVRNVAAHRWTVSVATSRDLLKDQNVRPLFADFPKSLLAAFSVTKSRLTRLRSSKAFGVDARTASKEMESRTILKILEGDAS